MQKERKRKIGTWVLLLLLLLVGCSNAWLISEGGNWAGAAAAGSGGYNAPVKIEGPPATPGK